MKQKVFRMNFQLIETIQVFSHGQMLNVNVTQNGGEMSLNSLANRIITR